MFVNSGGKAYSFVFVMCFVLFGFVLIVIVVYRRLLWVGWVIVVCYYVGCYFAVFV